MSPAFSIMNRKTMRWAPNSGFRVHRFADNMVRGHKFFVRPVTPAIQFRLSGSAVLVNQPLCVFYRSIQKATISDVSPIFPDVLALMANIQRLRRIRRANHLQGFLFLFRILHFGLLCKPGSFAALHILEPGNSGTGAIRFPAGLLNKVGQSLLPCEDWRPYPQRKCV